LRKVIQNCAIKVYFLPGLAGGGVPQYIATKIFWGERVFKVKKTARRLIALAHKRWGRRRRQHVSGWRVGGSGNGGTSTCSGGTTFLYGSERWEWWNPDVGGKDGEVRN